ncbi:hypothetical protein AcV5_006614 [Taiwanofungus camphoratus]|nr:hypothetical protein AcV5_006614 [Antrodia cinnamomea]
MSMHKDVPPIVSTLKHIPCGRMLVSLASGRNAEGPPHIALITGAGQGIGRAIALRLAHDGYDIAINDIPNHRPALQEVAMEARKIVGRRCLEIYADVSKEDDAKMMTDRTVDELGGLDVVSPSPPSCTHRNAPRPQMVANAGIALLEPLVDSTVSVCERTLAVNVLGVMLCYKHAARAMVAQGRGGRILGACSVAGKRGDPRSAAYCASKFAVRGLSQSAAVELAPHGINVNCYAPGAIHTELLDKFDDKYAEEKNEPKGSYIQKRAEAIPLGRVGRPEDVAGVVSWLAGEDSKFVTGDHGGRRYAL